ncbi:MAG: hypothetical protein HY318_11955 [Armatimonadetes bacterium]|nr:hypothetical protein [Armatimonadota bacterium]
MQRTTLLLLIPLSMSVIFSFAEAAPVEKSKVEIRLSSSGKRMIFIDSKPFPVFGAFGVNTVESLESVKAAGINALGIDVPWDKDLKDVYYTGLHDLATAAAEKQLKVVLAVAMVPPPQKDEPTMAVSPLSRPYVELLRSWLKYVVDKFKDLPNLLGYATQRDPAACIQYRDIDFQQYLRRWYSLPQNLSQMWAIQVPEFGNAKMELIKTIDQSRPAGFARASVDLAVYRSAALSELMALWAKELLDLDKDRLIFTGALYDYKSLIVVPNEYDVVVPAAFPTLVEPDVIAHNPHAIDIARQTNRFAAMPAFVTSGGRGVLNADVKRQLLNWINEGFLHGASGFWLSNWEEVHATETKPGKEKDAAVSEELEKALAKRLEGLEQTRVTEALPKATVAFLYEPFGEGLVENGNSLYGFADGLSLGEPNQPFIDFRRGTRYGLVDYLSHDDLLAADLSQYSTIFAPLCLWITPEVEIRLSEYVRAGGVLVADLGIGMAQSGAGFLEVPPAFHDLFGLWGMYRLVEQNRNMSILNPHELFPSLPVGALTNGLGEAGTAFTRPIGVVRIYGDTVTVGGVIRGTGSWRNSAATLNVHPFGAGFGVFAPFRLWSHWRPQNNLYAEFHSDLVRRGAIVSLNNDPALFPTTVSISAMDEGVAACNISDQVQYAKIDRIGISDLLYSNALTAVYPPQNAGSVSPAAVSSRSPIVLLLPQRIPQLTTLHLDLQPGELRYCKYLPIQLEPKERFAVARVTRYDKEEIEIKVFGTSTSIGLDRSGNLTLANPAAVTARLTIYPGDYDLPARSGHDVLTTTPSNKNPDKQVFTADDRGRLLIERKFQSQTITISPRKE